MARPAPQRPPSPGGKTSHLLAPQSDCAYAWPAPKWAPFRFQQAPAGRGSPNRHLRPPARLPGPVRAGLQNNCAPAITGMCIHQHPPCPLHVQSHVPISACSTRMRIPVPNAPGPRASRIRFPINIVPGHAPVAGPSSAANNPGPGSVRPRRSWGFLWQNHVKPAPPKLISSLFFCPLRLLWKKCLFSCFF